MKLIVPRWLADRWRGQGLDFDDDDFDYYDDDDPPRRRLRDRVRALVTVEIEWSGFAVTRGGFFEFLGPVPYEPWTNGKPPPYRIAVNLEPLVEPPAPVPDALRADALARVAKGLDLPEALVASGGYCAPSSWFDNPAEWQPWRRWYCAQRFALSDYLPTITVPRGGIRFIQPPPLGGHTP